MIFYRIVLFLLFFNGITAQITFDARNNGLAGSDIVTSKNSLIILTNPASLLYVNNSFSFFYLPGLYSISELSQYAGSLSFRTSIANFGVGYNSFAFDLYNEKNVYFSSAFSIIDSLTIGCSFTYNYIYIKNYFINKKINFDFSLLFHPFENLFTTIIIKGINLWDNKTFSTNKELNIQSGISYKINRYFTLFLSIEKKLRDVFDLKSGIETDLFEFISFRIGVANKLNIFASGVGLNYHNYSINYGITKHTYLGYSHSFDLSCKF